MVENRLTHTHTLWCHLDKFVGLDILKSLLKRKDCAGHDAGLVVGAAGAGVGELLGLSHIDYKVVVVDMLTDHLTDINLLARVDEELAAVLKFVYRIGIGSTRLEIASP